MNGILYFLVFVWYVVYIVQACFAYGTGYRLAKKGGDNGISLFGWLFVLQLAAMVPGLGIFLWVNYRDTGKVKVEVDDKAWFRYEDGAPVSQKPAITLAGGSEGVAAAAACPVCGSPHHEGDRFCAQCGTVLRV
ncbi:MAG: zinc ribbon domain-containing protein [Clostridiales bacterium]|nr:zinc ribbon domain-containing protein [Clostridiales bacterium]